MNVKIKATNLELTGAISDYTQKRVSALEKFIGKGGQSVLVEVEVGKITRHHKRGDIFRAEINIKTPERQFRAASEQEDLYAAIDMLVDKLNRQLVKHKEKLLGLRDHHKDWEAHDEARE